MTIQLTRIIPPFTGLTDGEKVKLVKQIRHVKMVEKPDVRVRKTRAAKKTTEKKREKTKREVGAMVKNLSKDQILELMKELQS